MIDGISEPFEIQAFDFSNGNIRPLPILSDLMRPSKLQAAEENAPK